MNSRDKWALGAVVATVGAFFAGWLTAPQSGKETREDIKDVALKAKSEAEKQLKSLYNELQSLLIEGKIKGADLKDKAKTEFDDAMQKAMEAKDKVKVVLSAVHDGAADDPELAKAIKQAKLAKDNLQKYWSK